MACSKELFHSRGFMIDKLIRAVLLLIGLLWFAGCGFIQSPSVPPQMVGTTSLNNFDFDGKPTQIQVQGVPERVIVARPEILDALLALHAENYICAAYITRDKVEQIPELQKKMPKAVFYTSEMDRETALMMHPDFILGWRMSFRKGALGDTAFWRERNIPVYIEENSGPVPAVDPFPPSTVETEMRFIQNMGQLFQKEEEANGIVRNIQSALDEGIAKAREAPARRVITIEFMRDKIEVFGDKLLSGDIIRKLGGTNIQFDTPFISREELRMCGADTLFIVYHGNEQEGANALAQIQVPEFSDIPAVKNSRVFLLPYRNVCASHVYTAQTIREISNGLYFY